jgi:hypothetical protein
MTPEAAPSAIASNAACNAAASGTRDRFPLVGGAATAGVVAAPVTTATAAAAPDRNIDRRVVITAPHVSEQHDIDEHAECLIVQLLPANEFDP